MFDLDAHILRWRRSLASWGIGKDRLEELEEHLRDSIEVRVRKGASEQEAFVSARNALGDPDQLKREYRTELLARVLDSTARYALSFNTLRIGALVTLATFLLIGLTIQNGPPGHYQAILFSFLSPMVWVTSALAALAVWASLSHLDDRNHKQVLRALLVVTVVSTVLLNYSPHSAGWSGAAWVIVILVLSFFLKGRRLIIGTVISWLSITLGVFVWIFQNSETPTNPFEMTRVVTLILDAISIAIMVYGLSKAPEAFWHQQRRFAQG